ncbi:MAG: hypothetical protein WDN08_07255 [Rhizomicrobium sp.]
MRRQSAVQLLGGFRDPAALIAAPTSSFSLGWRWPWPPAIVVAP